TTLTERLINSHGLGDTTQCLCSQVLACKIALDQAIGRFTDSNRIGRSQSLDARTHVWHFTERQLLLTPLSSHFPNNDQPCMDAHAESKLDTFIWLQTGIEVSHCIKDTQPRSYCSVGIIFMGVGI